MPQLSITEATTSADIALARGLILEYGDSRGFPLEWQDFDAEVATLPGDYTGPLGGLWIGRVDGEPRGCVAVRPLGDGTCEMKRLYVRPAGRGLGLGRLLAERAIRHARETGYVAMFLDTLERMEEAGGLYASLGFVPCDPYRHNPLPDVVYLRLDLTGGAAADAAQGDVAIRPARAEDAEAIARIYNQAVEHTTATFDTVPQTVADRLAWLDEHRAPQHPVLVAETGAGVVGWASLSAYSSRCAYEATVEASTYIDEAFRGRGLGMRLSEAVLEAGREGGVHAVLSRICTENEASLAMCRRLGYFEVGVMREVGRKFGRVLDVAMFEKLL